MPVLAAHPSWAKQEAESKAAGYRDLFPVRRPSCQMLAMDHEPEGPWALGYRFQGAPVSGPEEAEPLMG